jgi:3-oxoacyl-[acyl-carrier-protein] synthase II
MSKSPTDVVITGIGVVSSLGIGRAFHQSLLTGKGPLVPVVDNKWEAHYAVHPLPEIDWSEQIPRRGDQRQMENWQRIGVFAAGLALDDAGLKEDEDACANMDLIVAAGGGERDIAVDTLIVEESRKTNDRDVMLNEKLSTELRPTLFLAQLSNLLAGNISIVHKVTGSSRTFMGEEGSGVSAFETARARIAAGQSTHCLVGGALSADRPDIILMTQSVGIADSRQGEADNPLAVAPDGVVFGSAGAFLVLESREHAEARGAKIYATLDAVEGDRGSRAEGRLENRLAGLADRVAPDAAAIDIVISGAAGEPVLAAREENWLADRFSVAQMRRQAVAFGHAIEAQFPLAVALGAIAVSAEAPTARFSSEGEADMPVAPKTAIVTALGIQRGEGMARLSRAD